MNQKGMSKGDVCTEIASITGLRPRDVRAVLDALPSVVAREISRAGPGHFTVPGLCKLVASYKPATPGGTRPNPFRKGETMVVKAKPPKTVLKIKPLKALKNMT